MTMNEESFLDGEDNDGQGKSEEGQQQNKAAILRGSG